MMKKSYCALIFSLLTSIMCLWGCSVKEDRDACPCDLILDLSEMDIDCYEDLRVFITDESGPVYKSYSDFTDFWPEYGFSVPRSVLTVNVCSGEGGCFDDLKGVLIPYGEDCPRIFMYSSVVDARCESARDTVCLHKNHCVAEIYLEKDDADSRYELCLKGNVCGYGMAGQPIRGDFSCRPAGDPDRGYKVSLPRQVDTSLILEIDDGSEVLKTFALGEYIVAGGYDWNDPDLEDITVHINWTLTSVILTVSGWDWIYECEIVI